MRRFCPNCGQPVSVEASFCRSCGSTLADQLEVQSATDTVADAERIPERDLGQLVSETFTLYRNNFWPFYLIALIPQIPILVFVLGPWVFDDMTWTAWVILGAVAVVTILVASFLSFGATVHAVALVLSGVAIDVGACYSHAANRAVALIVAFIVIAVVLVVVVVVGLVVVGLPVAIFLFVMWVFVGQAVVLEGDGPISALGRSRFLVKGSWWRVFGIGVVYWLISIGLSIATLIPVGLLGLFSDFAASIVSTIASAAIAPIPFIGLTLLYIDLRVRNEGYTLRTLADQLRRANASTRRI